MKRCTNCGQLKPLEAFNKRKKAKDGLVPCCRQCQSVYNRQYLLRPEVRKSRAAYLENYYKTESYRLAMDRALEASNAKYATDPNWREERKASNKRYRTSALGRATIATRLARQETKEMLKRCNHNWHKKSPRCTLRIAITNALKRCPTANPATIDDLMLLYERQGGLCALSGIQMTWGSGKRRPMSTSISLDRIDNDKGYTADNLRLICHAINAFRGRMTDAEMLKMARAIVEFMEEPAAQGVAPSGLDLNDLAAKMAALN